MKVIYQGLPPNAGHDCALCPLWKGEPDCLLLLNPPLTQRGCLSNFSPPYSFEVDKLCSEYILESKHQEEEKPQAHRWGMGTWEG